MKRFNKISIGLFFIIYSIFASVIIPNVLAAVSGGGSVIYYADPQETNQGVVGNGRTIKALADAIGTTKQATIELQNIGNADKMYYLVSSNLTISSNITVKIDPGAVFKDDSNNAVLTINGSICASPHQVIFDWGNGTGNIILKNIAYSDWFKENTTPGITDLTNATQIFFNSLTSGGKAVLNSGIMAVNSLTVLNNTYIVFEPGTVLQQITQTVDNVPVLNLNNKDNITVENPVIIGDKATHVGGKGDQSHGISAYISNNIKIINPDISYAFGDGIYIKGDDISVEGGSISYCNRQGITILSGENIFIKDTVITHTNGTAPEAGIDIEPNSNTEYLKNIVLENVSLKDNKGVGIKVDLNNLDNTSDDVSITLNNVEGVNDGLYFRNGGVNGIVIVKNPRLFECPGISINIRQWLSSGARLEILNPYIKDSNQTLTGMPRFDSAITINCESTDNASLGPMGNIEIIRPCIVNASPGSGTYCIYEWDGRTGNPGIDGLMIIDPVKLEAAAGMISLWHTVNHLTVSDKNDLLVNDSLNSPITLSPIYLFKRISSKSFTSSRLITLSGWPINTELTFEAETAAYQIQIYEPSNDFLPLSTTPGKYIYSNEVGASITIKKYSSTSWRIIRQIGTWNVEP